MQEYFVYFKFFETDGLAENIRHPPQMIYSEFP